MKGCTSVATSSGLRNTAMAIRTGGRRDVTATHRAWMREDTGAFVPTPAVYQGRVYVPIGQGSGVCAAISSISS